ncbi:MAG: RiPP maturation radical SAM C-methyltransferase [Nitriliruptoraceae bacterium]
MTDDGRRPPRPTAVDTDGRPTIALVAMPWQSAHRPSLPLGLLAAVIRAETSWNVVQVPAYLDWLRWLLDADLEAAFTVAEYDRIADESFFHGVGDWVFAPALHGHEPGDDGYPAYVEGRGGEVGRAALLRPLASRFVAAMATQVLAASPVVVGCTTTFMQNTASLALLREVKRRDPAAVTVLGGANCDGPMGAALHRSFPFVDLVVRGEGEPAVVDLLDALGCPTPAAREPRLAAIPGLCWRPASAARTCSTANPIVTSPWNGLAGNPAPDHEPYFTRVEQLGLRPLLDLELVFEGSRGCWWGEKHHCTFCGLNGTLMTSRVRPTEVVLDEITSMIARYGVHDLVAVDNILAREHQRDLLPRLADAQLGATFHVETKSNLHERDLALFAAAGVTRIQAGVESLISDVLELMDKGVTGAHNVRTLRLCSTYGVRLSWNVLYGFPGEREADYRALIEAIPALWHLQPPAGAFRITLERFSPHHRDPSLGFAERRPAGFYPFVYPQLAPEDLEDLAYLFDTPDQGIVGGVADDLVRAVARWRAAHRRAYLRMTAEADRDIISDGRGGFQVVTLRDPTERALFRMALDGTSLRALERADARAEEHLTRWAQHRLVHRDGDRIVALPIPAPGMRFTRRDADHPATRPDLPVLA